MPETSSVEIRLLAQQGNTYPVEMTLTATQQVFRGQVSADLTVWTPSGDSRADGQALFSALFASADLMRGWGVAHGKSKQLRVQLRIDAPELHALPWELLRDDQDLLAANADSPFSRYLAVSREWGQPITDRLIRVLAVISNPKDIEEKYGLPPADMELETGTLEAAFNPHPGPLPEREREVHAPLSPAGRGVGGESVSLTFLPAPVTPDRLEAELRNGYHILHFVGHGAFNAGSQQAALFLQDSDGSARRVIDDDFAGMLNRLSSPPHLVVLSACQSAKQSMRAAFSGLGPKLVQIGVPAVIAMQENVTVLSARQFAATFYQRLLAHGTVDLAMNEARGSLITNGRFDAAVPVLFMRLPDGRLWDVLGRRRVQVIIEQDYPSFSTEKRQDLVRVLAALLRIEPDQIRILNVVTGSVVIEMEMPAIAANRLAEMFERKDLRLRGLKVASVIIEGELATSEQQARPEEGTSMTKKVYNRSGGVNFGSGNVTVGGDVVGRDKITTTNTGLSGEDVANLFASIYQQIDAKPNLPPRDKEDLKADVRDVEAETAKVAQGQKADESFLERRLRSIKRMAPDILDVIASTFASPSLGAAAVIRKVVDRVKQEAA